MSLFDKENDEPILVLLLTVVGWLQAAAGIWGLAGALSYGEKVDFALAVLLGSMVWFWMAEVLKLLGRK